MAEKAEYFLEQSFPEIVDLQRKLIFTSVEIKSIIKRRTEFEYALARRIVKKEDFLKYIEYEMNLEALRKKRIKRLNIKGKPTISDWGGVRRIFFLFERATQKFHGDEDLWLQYIRYAQHEKSTKLLGKVISKALQFHPTKPKLWIFAGYHELNWNGNISAARTLMQRGIRLNMYSSELWLEYCKMELIYIIKLHTRQKILGISELNNDKNIDEATKKKDMIMIPEITYEEYKKDNLIFKNMETGLLDSENVSVIDFQNSPIMKGEIVSIIIKTANEYMPKNIDLLESFYYMIESFENLICRDRLLNEIISLIEHQESSIELAKILLLILPLNKFLKNVLDISFPKVLKSSILGFNTLIEKNNCSVISYEKFCLFLGKFLEKENLDKNLRIVINSSLYSILKKLEIQNLMSNKLKILLDSICLQ
ncbi:hypothetical protein T552_01692 [Pneumocystis carinii B80]|uniref:U3 small nucleolar RNA-associated protein 6 N-terminal domain-containing protein n=1 Tax=Pneumocystis carinii (strain B80) TaxID=1408658 RepID=A0A0W4ZJ90_PNEC8|nr:hypothetical protein T552_01692 [Pneumocystis carinii B80]KTW28431.1 hypothetical protein T552_01692 [Pneumocystis carinii B80]